MAPVEYLKKKWLDFRFYSQTHTCELKSDHESKVYGYEYLTVTVGY